LFINNSEIYGNIYESSTDNFILDLIENKKKEVELIQKSYLQLNDGNTKRKLQLKEKMITELYPYVSLDIKKRSDSIDLDILNFVVESFDGKNKTTIPAKSLNEQEEKLDNKNLKLKLLNKMITKLITDMLVWESLIKDNNINIDKNTNNSQIVKQLKLIATTMLYYCYYISNLIDTIKIGLECTILGTDGTYIDNFEGKTGNYRMNNNLCDNLRNLSRAVYDVILSIQNYGFDNYDKNYDLIQINIAGLVNSLMLELYLFNKKNIPPPKKGGTIKKTKRNKKTKNQKRKRNNTKRKYNNKNGKLSVSKKSKFRRHTILHQK
jgi:hypothetical protein